MPSGSAAGHVVGRRVDAWRVAYRFTTVEPGGIWELARLQSEVRIEQPIEIGGAWFKASRKAHARMVLIQNADMRAKFDAQDKDGWAFVVDFSATYLATHTMVETQALADRVAAGIGLVLTRRLRRADLAVDVAGWNIKERDDEKFVLPRNANAVKYIDIAVVEDDFKISDKDFNDERPAQGQVKAYRNSRGVTGITICEGGDVMGRIYDKRCELGRMVSRYKRDLEESIWRSNGWDGVSPVARIEFQIRGQALKEFLDGIRAPEAFLAKLDSIWQYLTRRWTRMVMLGSATRKKRCEVDPRWAALQEVVFNHKAIPAKRDRVKGGANPLDTYSRMVSGLAARTALPMLREIARPTWPDVMGQIAEVQDAFSPVIEGALRQRFQNPEAAQRFVLDGHALATARYWSADDGQASATAQAA